MSVSEAVRAELARLRAVETVEGAIALALAGQLDEVRNGMAASGDAKELRAVISTLRERIPVKADPVDELNARRAARGATPQTG